MSYCVNCGVELESSIKECPLCHTPVINPNVLVASATIPPFSKEKGQVEVVKRKDFAVLISIVLLSTAITCALLNWLVFDSTRWSLPIIGICALIWIFAIPFIIYTKLSVYTSLLLDGFALGAYIWVISYITPSDAWFYQLALPIVCLVTLLLEVLVFLLKRFRVAYLTTAIYVFSEIAILCVGIEIFIDLFLHQQIHLTWSAVVLTVCTIIVITFITLVSKKRFRDAVRRRLHF